MNDLEFVAMVSELSLQLNFIVTFSGSKLSCHLWATDLSRQKLTHSNYTYESPASTVATTEAKDSLTQAVALVLQRLLSDPTFSSNPTVSQLVLENHTSSQGFHPRN